MISYPIPEEKRTKRIWSTYNPETGEFLRKNGIWPEADGNPKPQPAPIVWLETVDTPEPTVDSRYYYIEDTDVIDVANEELRIEHKAEKHAPDELKRQVNNRAATEQDKHLNHEKLLTQLPIMVGLLIQKTDLQEIPQEQRKELKKFLKRATQVIDNDTIVQQLEADVDAGLDIDLDGAPWATPLTEEELNAE